MLLSALQSIEVPPEILNSARSPEGARAAILYRAGEWNQAHEMVQDLDTPEGRFWHGIFHRHEGDWSNASYWFRRVGRHPVYASIQEDAVEIFKQNKVSRWQLGGEWDPLRFIHWCEETAQNTGRAEEVAATEIQVAEWRHLFKWCIE